MYRGKRTQKSTNTAAHSTEAAKNTVHKVDDADAFIYKDNEDYGFDKAEKKTITVETKVKQTIDDSVNIRKSTMVIDMPITEEEVKKKEEEEEKRQSEGVREAIPSALIDKKLTTNELSDDALMNYELESSSTKFNLNDMYTAFQSDFSEHVVKLYQSGDIKYKTTTIEFTDIDTNYTNTTLYNRAQYVHTSADEATETEEVKKGMLVAGDMLLYRIKTTHTFGKDDKDVMFNVAFYINEVMVEQDGKQKVMSKIKTDILNKPATTDFTVNGSDVMQSAIDTHGNVYIVRAEKTLESIIAYMQKETTPPNDYEEVRNIEPTNMSKDAGPSSAPSNFKSTKDNFKYGHLFFDRGNGADMLTLPHPSETGSVVLPDSFPIEDTDESTSTTIKPFDCYVKGYFVIYRVGVKSDATLPLGSSAKINEDYISQTYSFEMNEYSHIRCYTNSNNNVVLNTDWFSSTLQTLNMTGLNLYLNPYDFSITAPFCATGGFFTTNCTDSKENPTTNVFTIRSETKGSMKGDDKVVLNNDKDVGFCILSNNSFVGPNSYKLVMEALKDQMDEPIFNEDDDELTKSTKVSKAIQETKGRSCTIV